MERKGKTDKASVGDGKRREEYSEWMRREEKKRKKCE